MMMKVSNYFILLNPSIWPMITSVNLMNLVLSILMMAKSNGTSLIYSFVMMMSSGLMWMKDLNSETLKEGGQTKTLEETMKLFFFMFILSEVMVFFSLFWAYYDFMLFPQMEISSEWPPLMMLHFDWVKMPMVNTIILLTSSVTMTMSHDSVSKGGLKMSMGMLILTILMGILFTVMQAKEYSESYFSMNDSSFGSLFFMLTGLHGLHVMLGTMALMGCLTKFMVVNYMNNSAESAEMAAWYWHFVDLIWLFVYYSLYYLPN